MIIKHPNYIQPQIDDKLDHLNVGILGFYYVNPPKYQLEDHKAYFGLDSVAEHKIKELLDRYDFVESRYKHNIALIHTKYDHLNDITSEYWLTFEASYVTELIYIKKWLKYWKRIYEEVTNEKLIKFDFEEDKLTREQIDLAKEVPIEDLYAGDLRQMHGKSVGLCPFHEEKTPSFTIFSDNNYHCFGCQAHGDAIDFYMKQRDVDFITAVKELLNE